jgi:uncharacterized membrane protein YbjE (DUF340 family)
VSLNTPAIIYLVITTIVFLALAISTAMCLKDKKYCDEDTTLMIESPVLLFFVVVALALTWLLNLIYSRGYHITAWLLLIFIFPMGFGLFMERPDPDINISIGPVEFSRTSEE